METVWDIEINRLGWPAPVADEGEGGDTRFDVYLIELFSQGLGGYVSPDGGFVGDNPATPQTELQAAYGYLVLDNDYIDPNPPAGLRVWPPDQWVEIIAAHEFNHVLQIGINGSQGMNWWYESTANWMETQVFPALPDNLESAGAVFKSPDTCMLRYGGVNRVESGLHWYGMWVFDESLSEAYGPEIVLDIWDASADSGYYAPFDEVFAAYGSSFEDEVRRLALNVLLRNFDNGNEFPTARLQESVDGPGEWTPADGVQRYAMEYIGLNLSEPYTITLTSEEPGIQGIVVGVNGSSADVFPVDEGVTVNFGSYDSTYLVILNLTRPPSEAGCATARYTYAVETAAGEASGAVQTLNVPYFSEPRVEAITDPEQELILNPSYQTEYNVHQEIQEVALPFTPITPHGHPAGFELDSVYGVNANDLGEAFVARFAPSGGVVAQMLYYNSAGEMIRITESVTLYGTIGEWLAVNNLEFDPQVQIWTTGNIDTALITGDSGTQVVFISQRRFIVIDGDASQDAMLNMAARFAASAADVSPLSGYWDTP
jgi:hypothetical protein